jgi:hypothetical protein
VGSGGPVFFELNFAARRVREARSDRAISSAMAVAHGQTNCGRLPITSQLRSLGRMMRKPGQRKPKLLAWRGLFGRLHLFVRCTKAPEARFLRGALGLILMAALSCNEPFVICAKSKQKRATRATPCISGPCGSGSSPLRIWRSQGQGISLFLPLRDFERAYDGPPSEPKAFKEQHN